MNKMCSSCGESLPIGSFRQKAGKYSCKCITCETTRYCTYCGKLKDVADFGFSEGHPKTVCYECEAWQVEHLRREDVRIEADYIGF